MMVASLSLIACGGAVTITPYVSQKWGFSTAFPYAVNERVRGDKLTLSAPNSNDTSSYMVSVFSVSDGVLARKTPDKVLSDAVAGAVSNAHGELISVGDIVLDKFPGKAFVVRGDQFIARCRIYLVGTRVYLLMVIGLPYSSFPMDPEAFLTAFKLAETPK